jgi:DNA-directed RNA polymerase subunit E"
MKKKACRKCKLIVQGEKCPVCNSSSFTTNIKGRVYITDPLKSKVAQILDVKVKGEYAIRVR